MARVKNLDKVKLNFEPHAENMPQMKYKVNDILEEVNRIDTNDYVAILQYLMVQPFSKIRFMTNACADMPIFVKNICSAFLNDCKNGRVGVVNDILNRVLGLPKAIQETTTTSNVPQINVTLENNVDAENLNLLINGNNKDIQQNP